MQCINPRSVYKKTGNVTMGTKQSQEVPCGSCPACKKRRASGWSFRLVQEEKRSLTSNFITLTYATEHLPFTESGYMDLKKSDLQDFFKSLRHLQSGRKIGYFDDHPTIKYYACGEYGGETARPHYHVILFNAELKYIQDAWPNGNVHYGDVNVKSINYSLKYISKASRVGKTPGDNRTPEFAVMSKGLGDNYTTPEMLRWHHADPYKRMYCNLKDGKKIAMPRYYKNKIYTPEHRKAIGIKERQRIIAKEIKDYKKNPKLYTQLFQAHKAMIKNDIKEQSKPSKL